MDYAHHTVQHRLNETSFRYSDQFRVFIAKTDGIYGSVSCLYLQFDRYRYKNTQELHQKYSRTSSKFRCFSGINNRRLLPVVMSLLAKKMQNTKQTTPF